MMIDLYSRPIRCKIKTTCDMVTCVLLRLALFEFLLVHCITCVQRANQNEERIWRPRFPNPLNHTYVIAAILRE